MHSDSSFNEIYESIFPPIHRFVRMRIPGPDVDDVTAEIIVKVWRALPRFDGRSSLKTWALRIACNRVVDYYRAQNKVPVLPLDDDLVVIRSQADHSENVTTSLSISQTLAQMPEPQVAVIQLRLIESLSAAEAGEILGMTRDAVDSLLYRAKKSFRRIYAWESTGGSSQ